VDGHVFVYAAGSKGVLVVIAPASANTGLIHLEARETAKLVATTL
jgi:hypothetical protein